MCILSKKLYSRSPNVERMRDDPVKFIEMRVLNILLRVCLGRGGEMCIREYRVPNALSNLRHFESLLLSNVSLLHRLMKTVRYVRFAIRVRTNVNIFEMIIESVSDATV